MDYITLAWELGEVKRLTVKARNLHKITDLENGESFVLSYLSRNIGSVNPKEISGAMGVSSARMAAILNQLEAKGLVKREVNSENGKLTIIRLLPKGVDQQQENEKKYLEGAVKFLEALGPDDAQAYVRIREKIAKIHEEKGDEIFNCHTTK